MSFAERLPAGGTLNTAWPCRRAPAWDRPENAGPIDRACPVAYRKGTVARRFLELTGNRTPCLVSQPHCRQDDHELEVVRALAIIVIL